jgi:DNA-binding PadR family transcriptional regulator
MTSRPSRIGPMAVSTLALLAERPMHPYEMVQTMVARSQDQLLKIRPGSLYHTVDRLVDDGLVASVGTEREGNRPERTVYGITDEGRDALTAGTIALLKTPINEFPVFAFALSEAHNLDVATVRDILSSRLDELRASLRDADTHQLAVTAKGLPRRFFIELEYVRSQRDAQAAWIEALLRDLDSGDLDWSALPHSG